MHLRSGVSVAILECVDAFTVPEPFFELPLVLIAILIRSDTFTRIAFTKCPGRSIRKRQDVLDWGFFLFGHLNFSSRTG